ncbi:MAG TPA: thioredoxin family protein [Thermopetrobacter sp.]|nr:thioredoxin family protein [Thermopetrobacter sp.]
MRAAGALLLLLATALPAAAAQLIFFDSAGCPYCIRWKKEVGVIYHKTEEGKRAPLRVVDIGAPLPPELNRLKVPFWTPTFVLLDDNGHEVGRIEGYQGEDLFWARLQRLLMDMQSGAPAQR